jgi:hypothetical protein
MTNKETPPSNAETLILDMPGTIGGAKLVFVDQSSPEEEEAFKELEKKLSKKDLEP